MVDNIVTKPLGLVLIVTVHMAFNGASETEVTKMTGILGSDITLKFTFVDRPIHQKSYFAVYISGEKKIAECNDCIGNSAFEVTTNDSVLYHIKNLKQNDSQMYWATVFSESSTIKSNKVELDIREENISSTVPPIQTNSSITESNGSSSSIATVLVVSPVVLLAAILPWLIWCLVRSKDKQQPAQQNSNPTLQETVESNGVPPPSVIYSVLDFPKRPSAVLEISPNDTEYAAVSYLPEKGIV